jgi:hypothetical protein
MQLPRTITTRPSRALVLTGEAATHGLAHERVPAIRRVFLTVPAGAGPIAALVLASLLWGTADVAGKLALVAIPPATLAALRFGVALAILWLLARWRGGGRVPMRITAPLGVLGVALTFLLQNLGLAQTTATNASLLQGAAPVLTLLMAAAVLGERLGARRSAAVAAALAGVTAVTLAGGGGLHPPGLGGIGLAVSEPRPALAPVTAYMSLERTGWKRHAGMIPKEAQRAA